MRSSFVYAITTIFLLGSDAGTVLASSSYGDDYCGFGSCVIEYEDDIYEYSHSYVNDDGIPIHVYDSGDATVFFYDFAGPEGESVGNSPEEESYGHGDGQTGGPGSGQDGEGSGSDSGGHSASGLDGEGNTSGDLDDAYDAEGYDIDDRPEADPGPGGTANVGDGHEGDESAGLPPDGPHEYDWRTQPGPERDRLNRARSYEEQAREFAKNARTYRAERLHTVDVAGVLIDAADISFSQGRSQMGHHQVDTAMAAIDAALSFAPGVGLAKDVYSLATGRNPITQELVSSTDRAFIAATLFLPAGIAGGVRAIAKTARLMGAVAGIGKRSASVARRVLRIIRRSDDKMRRHVGPPCNGGGCSLGTITDEATQGGWLLFHEGASWGGHTIARHTGKTFEDLRARLASNPGMNRASSFFDQTTAETSVSRIFGQNRAGISAWARSAPAGTRKAFDLAAGTEVLGRGVVRRAGRYLDLNNLTGARVVLESTGGGNYKILTAFPQ